MSANPYVSKNEFERLAMHANRENRVLAMIIAYAFKGGDLKKPMPVTALAEVSHVEFDLKVEGDNFVLVEKT